MGSTLAVSLKGKELVYEAVGSTIAVSDKEAEVVVYEDEVTPVGSTLPVVKVGSTLAVPDETVEERFKLEGKEKV